jgi:HEAT repeat protein
VKVSAEEILAVVESPAENAGLLLNGLMNGDSSETRCLAATLLGDCDPSDVQIRAALKSVSETETGTGTDPRLMLAAADSQIQRGEADESTADCLIELIQEETGETRTQALLDLRHFARTESHEECVAVLQSLLNHEEGSIRAIAAMTLEDFTVSTTHPAVGQSEVSTEVPPKAIGRTTPAARADQADHIIMTRPLLPDPK